MRFLPVVDRELRVAARRGKTYWTRFFAVLGALAICTGIWSWLAKDQPASERGLLLFQTISALAFVYCWLAGIGVTADCLSEEKREGTLGLLFLTDLRGYDVVLGKLAATSLHAIYRLFAVFPILAVPLLLGALTLGEFGRMTLVLSNTLLFSLSAGILVSTLSVRERNAMAGTFFLLLLITAVPPLLGLTPMVRSTPIRYNPAWLLSSSVYPALLAFDAPYKANPGLYWSAVATTQVLTWGFLLWASLVVPRSWQDRPRVATPWLDRWRKRIIGEPSVVLAYRRRLLEINPIFWLSARDRLKPVYVFGALGGVGLALLGLYWKYGSSVLDPAFYILTAYAVHTLIKFWLTSEACRFLVDDRRSGALELVLSSPLTIDDILAGHFLALKRQFGAACGVILCLDFAILLAGTNDRLLEGSQDWILLCLGLMILFVADLYTLAWVGLWLSLNAKKAIRALNGTVARILILPWGILALILTLMATVQWQGPEAGEMGLLVLAFATALINNALFLPWARKNLREKFRLRATQRFETHLERAASSGTVLPAVARPLVTP